MPNTFISHAAGVWKSTSTMVGLLLTFALILSACSVSASTANISDAKMTRDEAGKNPTKVFSPNDQTFYLIAELSNAPEDTAVKAVWTAVDVEGVKPNLKIDESRITADESGQLTFDLTNDGPWPVGEYNVELFINDEEEPARTLEFKVQ
jgi:PBP1b-binding outer membrane lipoprotein LpoB